MTAVLCGDGIGDSAWYGWQHFGKYCGCLLLLLPFAYSSRCWPLATHIPGCWLALLMDYLLHYALLTTWLLGRYVHKFLSHGAFLKVKKANPCRSSH